MYRKSRNQGIDKDEDSDDSPVKSTRFVKKSKPLPAHAVEQRKSPEPDSLELENRVAQGFLDREINNLEILVVFCKDQFKDVYELFKVAKNRILKVE